MINEIQYRKVLWLIHGWTWYSISEILNNRLSAKNQFKFSIPKNFQNNHLSSGEQNKAKLTFKRQMLTFKDL